MDYHCTCGYDFFMEEGYNHEMDIIICPMCGKIVEVMEVK